MRIKLPHAPYISRKIAIDLLNSGFVTLTKGIELVSQKSLEIIENDILKEKTLDEKVNKILDEKENDMQEMGIDPKNMFWLIKKQIAQDEGFILDNEDRFSTISHEILKEISKNSLVSYKVSENRVKNLIYNSIVSYMRSYEDIEDIVAEKIENMQRKLIPATHEYELVFEQLYLEELKKRGMF